MNRLARNLVFSLKNPEKIRTIASCVCLRTVEKSEIVSVQTKSFHRNQQNNALSIQKLYSTTATVSQLNYENFCVETLDGLCDYFEELIESVSDFESADVVNKDGVLTVSLGSTHGTYVINKQSPNKQIWLSSPTSGPKRYDFTYAKNDIKTGYWVYKRTGETLHELLDRELSDITKTKTNFQSLAFGSRC